MFEMLDDGVLTFVFSAEEAAGMRKERIKVENRERVYARGATEHRQKNAALGLLSASEITAITDAIQACRDECHALEAQIDNILADDSLSEADKVSAIEAVGFN